MAANPHERPRILIVEDELLVASDLQMTLEDLGYQVVGIAESGPGALQIAEKSQPDIVLMDIQLRGSMNGAEAAEVMRRRWQLPVVFLTSNANARMQARAHATAPYGYLLKPFRPVELDSTLMTAVAQNRSARDLFSRETWLRTVLDGLNDSIIATDLEGRVRYMNPSAEHLTGCTPEEAVGKRIEQTYKLRTFTGGPVEKYQVRLALDSASSLGRERFLLTRNGGETIAIENSASPIVIGDQVLGAVDIMRDITERVRHEQLEEAERDRLEDEMLKANEALGQTRAALRALSSHLITAQEEERRRLARELHDDFGQRAAVLGMHVTRAIEQFRTRPEETRNLLTNISAEVAELNRGLREVSHRLHPSMLEDLGLVAALRSLVRTFRDGGGDLSARLPKSLPRLGQDAATALFRIVQEALTNARKHAPGAPVHLTLGVEKHELELVIRDAGPGFDLVAGRIVNRGMGLLSMQERARLANGTLHIASRPGEGTVVRVSVPF